MKTLALLFLVLSLAACQNTPSNQATPTAEETKPVTVEKSEKKTPEAASTDTAPTPEVAVVAAENTDNDNAATEQPSTATNRTDLPRVNMGISDDKMSAVLESIADNLTAKKLKYISAEMQDCSGIYHQMKDSIQVRLPALAQFQFPLVTEARSSRQIANWYYEKNNLLLVEDAMASRNAIRPGSVVFFGKSGKKFSDITIDQLTDRNNGFTKNGAIQHIAVVTSVWTDEEENVIAYDMMHARYPDRTLQDGTVKPGKPASKSGSKEVQSTRTKGLPPFGNWQQQLVAIANIATSK